MCRKLWILMLFAAFLFLPLLRLSVAEPNLESNFENPPDSARPWVFWFWLNGNVTRDGITADLEAMKRVGIGGVLIMEVDQGTPAGPVAFMSDEWRALFRHTVAEAGRLGLEVNINNDAGWSGSGGPWIRPDKGVQTVVSSEIKISGGKRFEGKLPSPAPDAEYYRDIAVIAFPTPSVTPGINNLPAKSVAWAYISGYSTGTDRDAVVSNEAIIPRKSIVDLSEKMNAEGMFVWDVPETKGTWSIVRFGHRFAGTTNHPAPASGTGPECDKLSKEAVKTHFDGMIGRLVTEAGPLAGRTFVSTHVDSWENGAGNWTPKMREEFRRLRGYDMVPFLPVLTDRFVGNVDVTERFLWDLRQTASDLFETNYIAYLAQLSHANNIKLSMEAYGTPALDADVVNHVDEPMCEFWWSGGGRLDYSVKSMSSAAHVNGRVIVGAEAFTSNRREKWRGYPANIKARGDRMFCGGVNRFVFHRYAMQPWVQEIRPGMSMGPYGLHYERTQTWWDYSKAWHQYVARCQYLLRQGLFVADVLSLQPEEPMQRFNLLDLAGYDYDGISPKAFLNNVAVENGSLILPSGMRYRLLALSATNTRNMSVPVLRKIRRLVEDGAVILGSAPDAAPGLEGYPRADAEIKKIAGELWGTDETVKERIVGKGRVFRGMKPEEVLSKLDVAPDFSSDSKVQWIHRAVDGVDIYFVATCVETQVSASCTFRVAGKQPELWNPETGKRRDLPNFCEKGGCTKLPLEFTPSGSMFVVFRNKVKEAQRHKGIESKIGSNFPELKTVQEIVGPWSVQFDPKWSGLTNAVTFEKLDDWAKRPEAEIKYFSGSACYSKIFELPQSEVGDRKSKMCLDLGKVAVIAWVKLNGKDLGILWKPPYQVDITEAVKKGGNVLEVSVVNLWINRMIGDELLPDDCERNGDGSLKTWPTWLQEGKPSPAGRFSFTTWKHWKKGETLHESGLIGPVQIMTE